MIFKACSHCKFHDIRQEEETQNSYCRKEGCWSENSDCIALKALERFLKEEQELRIVSKHRTGEDISDL
jgi:hypothetical protein